MEIYSDVCSERRDERGPAKRNSQATTTKARPVQRSSIRSRRTPAPNRKSPINAKAIFARVRVLTARARVEPEAQMLQGAVHRYAARCAGPAPGLPPFPQGG